MTDEPDRRPMPWLTIGFDWEGLVAAGGSFLIALLLGWLWAPLFWFGFAAMVIALLGARWSHREPPDFVDGILAPCDGVVVSVMEGEAPFDIRLDQSHVTRVRIASAPTCTNKLYSPINGGLAALNIEPGDPAVPFATRPDEAGLASASLIFESQGEQVGVRFMTGGLGPRLEFDIAEGDVVRLGRVFGTRRLGGWCDLYLPAHAGALVWPGQTLVGGETVLGRFRAEEEPVNFEDAEIEAPMAVTDAVEAAPEAPPAEANPLDEDYVDDDDYPLPDEVEVADDPAVIFARIREAARKHGESD
jgi:phosphatidylserine decarboxylase